MEVFSDVMKRRMKELHPKQRELAKMLGVCPSYISTTLKDRKNLTIVTVVRFAEALNLKVKIEYSPMPPIRTSSPEP